ncbi:MAG: sigma 54-interacting transcriptional regulator [Thermoanaerobaculia bacterium]|nr:sigma 54-interacting transcriptional regulator [Thermoanaerobaculia bacterium]
MSAPVKVPGPLAELLVGQPRLARHLTHLPRAAASLAPLLLVGEAGTGRTALARAAHAESPRRNAPLVELDAGAVPVALFESELFGHRPGAFTGATTVSAGRLARAAGGSLLLDHVEEFPLAVQPKLLRVLSEGVYAPLGDVDRPADVRVISIADDNLAERLERGTFRRDLFHRLEVLAFRVPPLRERPTDLPSLCDRLVADLAERYGRPGLELAPEACAWMREHRWPGNLRELKNVLERAVLSTPPGVPLNPEPPVARRPPRVVPRPLAEVEAEAIRAALVYTEGHQTEAARLLGISRKSLWERRKRLAAGPH